MDPVWIIPATDNQSVSRSWRIVRRTNIWMVAFYEWIGNEFTPLLVKNDFQLPVIVFFEHKMHLTHETIDVCISLRILVIAVHSNSIQILQPCDCGAFRLLKPRWNKAFLPWRKNHPHGVLTKMSIAPILNCARKRLDMAIKIVSGQQNFIISKKTLYNTQSVRARL